MTGLRKTMAGTLCAAALLSTFALSRPAQAGSEGKRNTTLVLGAIAANEILRGHTTNAIVAGAATALAYGQYRDAKRYDDRYDWRHRRRFDDRRDYGRYDGDYGRYDGDYGRYDGNYGRYGRDGRDYDRDRDDRYGRYDRDRDGYRDGRDGYGDDRYGRDGYGDGRASIPYGDRDYRDGGGSIRYGAQDNRYLGGGSHGDGDRNGRHGRDHRG